MRRAFAITVDAYWHFLADDGWAIASHIALSVLMAMFPFSLCLPHWQDSSAPAISRIR